MKKLKSLANGCTRRAFLKAGAGASALALDGSIGSRVFAQQLRKVQLTLPWVAEGTNLFLWVARNKGYWKKRGLDVELIRGYGASAAAETVGAGRFPFGYCNPPSAILQTAKGLPLVAIGSINYDAVMGVVTLADSGIRVPKDLEGRTLASTISSQEYPLLPLFAKNSDLDLNKVKRTSVEAQLRQKILIQKQIDAISGSINSIVPSLAAQGIKTHSMLYKQYGIELYGGSVVTTPAMLKNEPALCDDIVQGALEGLAFTLTNPDEALKAFAAEVKEVALAPTALEQVRISMGMFALNAIHADPEQNGMGWHNPKTMAAMTDIVMNYLVGPSTARPNIDELYTNRFVGKVNMTSAQWQAAKDRFKPFGQYFE